MMGKFVSAKKIFNKIHLKISLLLPLHTVQLQMIKNKELEKSIDREMVVNQF